MGLLGSIVGKSKVKSANKKVPTNNALLFSDEIASKPCNHNILLYVVILC